MDFQRLGGNPFPVFVITSILCNFAYIDFWIEVCGKSLMMIACIAIDNIQVLDFIEVMFGCISRIDATYSRIESTT